MFVLLQNKWVAFQGILTFRLVVLCILSKDRFSWGFNTNIPWHEYTNYNLVTVRKRNKNAFQWDAYRPLVDRIPACTVQRGVWPRVCLPRGVYPSMQWGRHPPCGQTDTCENITFANFVCGW